MARSCTSIPERGKRSQAIASRWIQFDPDAATKWIQASDQLPADLKTKLLAPK